MSGDPIALSNDEERAAYRALEPLLSSVALNRSLPDYAVVPIVEVIVNAINKVRAGDPAGTIRRSVTGTLAILMGGPAGNRWRLLFTSGDISWGDVDHYDDWSLVYSPEAI
jgi:hypothetical protein